MISLLRQFCPTEGVHSTPSEAVKLYRSDSASPLQHGLQKPALCLLLEGRKEVYLGAEVYAYDPDHYLLVSVDLPISGRVVEGPYLGVSIELDPTMIQEVSLQVGQVAPASQPGIQVSPFEPMLRDAVERYLKLLHGAEHLPVLGSMILREIVYHLLHGPQAAALQRLAGLCGPKGVMRAVEWLKQNYAEPLSIEELASSLALSPSGLHHQFKTLTTMSPLQYQKQVRLQEARRLLLSSRVDAATVGFQVGYNSPSQFSREYRRMFGAPPQKDAARLRVEDMN